MAGVVFQAFLRDVTSIMASKNIYIPVLNGKIHSSHRVPESPPAPLRATADCIMSQANIFLDFKFTQAWVGPSPSASCAVAVATTVHHHRRPTLVLRLSSSPSSLVLLLFFLLLLVLLCADGGGSSSSRKSSSSAAFPSRACSWTATAAAAAMAF